MAIYHSLVYGRMRKLWLGIGISSFIGITYFIYLYYSEKGLFPSLEGHLGYFALCALTTNIIGLALYYSDRILNKLVSWSQNLSGRFFLGFIINTLIAFLILGAIGVIFLKIDSPQLAFNEYTTVHYDVTAKLLILTIIGILIYTVINFALYSYHQYNVVHIESAKNQRKQLELQFEALKSQLSPHYLFNCLNTISSLIFKDPHLAEDFIRRLASTYQYILNNNAKRFVTLQQEIEFVKSYNYLLQVRFENNLKLDINLPPNIMDSKIPPLTLQMLVENAVKHNVISKDKPLSIYISAIDNTDISITNTKTEKPLHVHSMHVGLENIIKRYQFFTTRNIRIDDAHKYTVMLPVIQNKPAKSA
ncbi:histidine kinase [Fulvivirga sp.]|uniref:sensor histidine kinase n=1 Tax=Fulvivirga sp. TaxID=1931237 RepID=UPI0032ED7F5B